jgi:hypothetical protein
MPGITKGKSMGLVAEVCGWLGALAVLGGYGAFSLGWIGNGRLFQGCNLFGSATLIVNGWYHAALPSVALNLAWSTISAVALVRTIKARRAARPLGLRHPDLGTRRPEPTKPVLCGEWEGWTDRAER